MIGVPAGGRARQCTALAGGAVRIIVGRGAVPQASRRALRSRAMPGMMRTWEKA
jgi:hypothetical protein